MLHVSKEPHLDNATNVGGGTKRDLKQSNLTCLQYYEVLNGNVQYKLENSKVLNKFLFYDLGTYFHLCTRNVYCAISLMM